MVSGNSPDLRKINKRNRIPSDDSLDGTHAGYFVIGDISGYTGFLTNNELAHAHGILAEISDLLIEKLSAPLRFVELEGDAVFVFAPDVAVEDSERRVDNRATSHGRWGVGMESHCDHGSYRLNHRIIDWQPFDYISTDTVSVGTSIAKPPNGRVTFAMQDLPGGRCKVSMRMHANDRGILSKLMLSLFGWLPKKQWRDHYRVLARLVRDDMARAEAATAAVAPRPAQISENAEQGATDMRFTMHKA
ncbi:MAG: hypothetical protein JSW26_05450 [Desulfobacterales bacterium]|nr:MAG: hypothetical protein JSW26_05450 [Desulfobacterales bacterium]